MAMTRQDIEEMRRIEVEIASLRKQIRRLEDERIFISSIQLDGVPRKGYKGDGADRIIRYLERSQRLERKLADKLQKRLEDEEQAYALLETIPDHEMREIVSLRCLEMLTWREIGERLNIDRTTAAKKYANFWKKR